MVLVRLNLSNPNFEDRISFDFEIGPIALEDMKGMIDHRVQATGGTPGSWFTEKGILKIHKNTQGYPRKVTQLCHQLLMTMMSDCLLYTSPSPRD